jgi:hypothetical protein
VSPATTGDLLDRLHSKADALVVLASSHATGSMVYTSYTFASCVTSLWPRTLHPPFSHVLLQLTRGLGCLRLARLLQCALLRISGLDARWT